MKKLKNWDNKTWLSSKSYISQFNKFLKRKSNLNKNSKILDIGCGRANIISALQQKYKFRNKPIGIDFVNNKGVKKYIIKILFLKIFSNLHLFLNLLQHLHNAYDRPFQSKHRLVQSMKVHFYISQ